MSRARAAQSVALDEANKVYENLLAGGVSKSEAAESASRIYDAEYRHALEDLLGEDFRRDEFDEPDVEEEPDE